MSFHNPGSAQLPGEQEACRGCDLGERNMGGFQIQGFRLGLRIGRITFARRKGEPPDLESSIWPSWLVA